MERTFAQVGDSVVAAQHAISLCAPLGTERPVAPNLVAAGPYSVLVGIQIRLQVGRQHIGIGDLRRTRVATIKHHRVIASCARARGIAVHRIENVGTALVAQGNDGRERQIVGGGIGHARDGGLVAFLLKNLLQGETLAQVGFGLPRACRIALGERIDDHVAVIAVIATMPRVDIDMGLLGSSDTHDKGRQHRHDRKSEEIPFHDVVVVYS